MDLTLTQGFPLHQAQRAGAAAHLDRPGGAPGGHALTIHGVANLRRTGTAFIVEFFSPPLGRLAEGLTGWLPWPGRPELSLVAPLDLDGAAAGGHAPIVAGKLAYRDWMLDTGHFRACGHTIAALAPGSVADATYDVDAVNMRAVLAATGAQIAAARERDRVAGILAKAACAMLAARDQRLGLLPWEALRAAASGFAPHAPPDDDARLHVVVCLPERVDIHTFGAQAERAAFLGNADSADAAFYTFDQDGDRRFRALGVAATGWLRGGTAAPPSGA